MVRNLANGKAVINDRKDMIENLHEFLKNNCPGRIKAKKAADLAGIFNTTIREINETVRQLRKSGYLVGSSKEHPYGYYIPTTETEIKIYLNAFRYETLDMLQTLNRQKRVARRYIEDLRSKDLFLYKMDNFGQLILNIAEPANSL